MELRVDRDRCCGAGLCAMLLPEVFDQRESDGLVELLLPRPPAELHDRVRHAVYVCPGRAITEVPPAAGGPAPG